MEVVPAVGCDIYGTNQYFEVEASGRGCLRGVSTVCSGGSINWRTSSLTFVASQNDDDSWTIDDVEPEPD